MVIGKLVIGKLVIGKVDVVEITSGEELRQAILDTAEQTEVGFGVSRGGETRQVVVRFPGPDPTPPPVLAGTETVRAEPAF